jgi:hypothetical protein
MTTMVFTPNPAGIAHLTKSPTGAVARYILRQAVATAAAARLRAPRDTGKLAASITASPFTFGGGPAAIVNASAPYAVYVHEGTRPHPIDPSRATVLRFPAKSGMIVFTPHVEHPGTRAQPFLVEALRQVIAA